MLAIEMMGTQFGYNDWANGRILTKAAFVSDEQLNQDTDVNDQSLRQILGHIARVERVWRLLAETGQVEPSQLPSDESLSSVNAIESILAEEHRNMQTYLAGISEDDLSASLTITRWDGIKVVMIRWHMLTHMLLHSMQHRSEAAVLLTNYGHSPGNIDFLFYFGED